MKRSRFEQNKSNIRSRETGAATVSRKRRRRRSSVAKMALVVTVLLVAAVGTVLSLTVFFKIKSIDVYGETRYSSKEIIKVANVQLESNLVRLDSEAISDKIEKELPYIEEVKIKKRLPTTLEFKVVAAKIAGYIAADDGYYIVSTEGKLLEKTADKPEKMAEINGITLEKPVISQYISGENDNISYVKKIYEAFGEGMSSNITSLSVGDRIDLSFVYNGRVTVKLGSESDLSKKLKFVVKIISDPNEISEDDMGIIYAGNAKKISFLRKGSYTEYISSLESEQETSSGIAQSEVDSSQTQSNAQNSSSSAL
ncbi:MAG: FtsQ-type POTRA domain-containing protein [Oscillospiraceae bacterium]|nr:FtsQ-type POTRA domain-containing protein [Oscillospiraceae bacterium]